MYQVNENGKRPRLQVGGIGGGNTLEECEVGRASEGLGISGGKLMKSRKKFRGNDKKFYWEREQVDYGDLSQPSTSVQHPYPNNSFIPTHSAPPPAHPNQTHFTGHDISSLHPSYSTFDQHMDAAHLKSEYLKQKQDLELYREWFVNQNKSIEDEKRNVKRLENSLEIEKRRVKGLEEDINNNRSKRNVGSEDRIIKELDIENKDLRRLKKEIMEELEKAKNSLRNSRYEVSHLTQKLSDFERVKKDLQTLETQYQSLNARFLKVDELHTSARTENATLLSKVQVTESYKAREVEWRKREGEMRREILDLKLTVKKSGEGEITKEIERLRDQIKKEREEKNLLEGCVKELREELSKDPAMRSWKSKSDLKFQLAKQKSRLEASHSKALESLQERNKRLEEDLVLVRSLKDEKIKEVKEWKQRVTELEEAGVGVKRKTQQSVGGQRQVQHSSVLGNTKEKAKVNVGQSIMQLPSIKKKSIDVRSGLDSTSNVSISNGRTNNISGPTSTSTTTTARRPNVSDPPNQSAAMALSAHPLIVNEDYERNDRISQTSNVTASTSVSSSASHSALRHTQVQAKKKSSNDPSLSKNGEPSRISKEKGRPKIGSTAVNTPVDKFKEVHGYLYTPPPPPVTPPLPDAPFGTTPNLTPSSLLNGTQTIDSSLRISSTLNKSTIVSTSVSTLSRMDDGSRAISQRTDKGFQSKVSQTAPIDKVSTVVQPTDRNVSLSSGSTTINKSNLKPPPTKRPQTGKKAPPPVTRLVSITSLEFKTSSPALTPTGSAPGNIHVLPPPMTRRVEVGGGEKGQMREEDVSAKTSDRARKERERKDQEVIDKQKRDKEEAEKRRREERIEQKRRDGDEKRKKKQKEIMEQREREDVANKERELKERELREQEQRENAKRLDEANRLFLDEDDTKVVPIDLDPPTPPADIGEDLVTAPDRNVKPDLNDASSENEDQLVRPSEKEIDEVVNLRSQEHNQNLGGVDVQDVECDETQDFPMEDAMVIKMGSDEDEPVEEQWGADPLTTRTEEDELEEDEEDEEDLIWQEMVRQAEQSSYHEA